VDGRWWYHRGPVLRPDHTRIILHQEQRVVHKAPEVGSDQQGRQTSSLCREPHQSKGAAVAPPEHVQDGCSVVGKHPKIRKRKQSWLPLPEQSSHRLLFKQMKQRLNKSHSCTLMQILYHEASLDANTRRKQGSRGRQPPGGARWQESLGGFQDSL